MPAAEQLCKSSWYEKPFYAYICSSAPLFQHLVKMPIRANTLCVLCRPCTQASLTTEMTSKAGGLPYAYAVSLVLTIRTYKLHLKSLMLKTRSLSLASQWNIVKN